MAESTNVTSLVQASACYICIPNEMSDAVTTMLLNEISGLNLTPAQLMSASACYQCIPPGHHQEVQTMMLESILVGIDPVPPEIDVVASWAERVEINGGEKPLQSTVDTLYTFYNGLVSAGLADKMIAVNCFVPDNLIAAITPLIVHPEVGGFDPWTNVGFVASDLSPSGLTGNSGGIGKTLRTGLQLTNCFPNTNSAGITIYNTLSDTTVRHDCAIATNSGANSFQLLTCYDAGQTAYFDCFNNTTGRVSGPALPGGVGYTSGNRISATDARIYIAKSTVPHAQTGAMQAGASGTLFNTGTPVANIPVFCMFDGTVALGSYLLPTAKRFSFVAIHEGLTQAESSAFFNLIQAMRISLGGGFA